MKTGKIVALSLLVFALGSCLKKEIPVGMIASVQLVVVADGSKRIVEPSRKQGMKPIADRGLKTDSGPVDRTQDIRRNIALVNRYATTEPQFY